MSSDDVDSKPREWWIYPETLTIAKGEPSKANNIRYTDPVRVIEISAFERAQAEIISLQLKEERHLEEWSNHWEARKKLEADYINLKEQLAERDCEIASLRLMKTQAPLMHKLRISELEDQLSECDREIERLKQQIGREDILRDVIMSKDKREAAAQVLIEQLAGALNDLKHQNHHKIEEEVWRIDNALAAYEKWKEGK